MKSMGKLAAMLFFVACAVVVLVAGPMHQWLPATLAGLAAMVALTLAFAAERGIVREKNRRNLEQLQAWDGADLTVPFNWIMWLAYMALCGVLGLVFGLMARTGPGWPLVFGATVALSAGYLFVIGIWLGLAALRNGCLLRMDFLGIHGLRHPTVLWRNLEVLDLEWIPSWSGNGGNYSLIAVLRPQVAHAWPRRLRNGNQARFGLGFVVGDIDLLLREMRLIAERHGVTIGRRLAECGPLPGEDANVGAQHA
jgi:hypothetical protein